MRSSVRRVSQAGAAAGAAGRSCAKAGAAAKPPAIAAATSPRLIPPALERFYASGPYDTDPDRPVIGCCANIADRPSVTLSRHGGVAREPTPQGHLGLDAGESPGSSQPSLGRQPLPICVPSHRHGRIAHEDRRDRRHRPDRLEDCRHPAPGRPRGRRRIAPKRHQQHHRRGDQGGRGRGAGGDRPRQLALV